MIIPVLSSILLNNSYQESLERQKRQRAEREAEEARNKLNRINEENKRHQEALDEINGIHHVHKDEENWISRLHLDFYKLEEMSNYTSFFVYINQELDRIYEKVRNDFFKCMQDVELTNTSFYRGEEVNLKNAHLLMDNVIDSHFEHFREHVFPFIEDNDGFIDTLEALSKGAVKDKLRAEAHAYATMIRINDYGY